MSDQITPGQRMYLDHFDAAILSGRLELDSPYRRRLLHAAGVNMDAILAARADRAALSPTSSPAPRHRITLFPQKPGVPWPSLHRASPRRP